jgi:hypothetical protein
VEGAGERLSHGSLFASDLLRYPIDISPLEGDGGDFHVVGKAPIELKSYGFQSFTKIAVPSPAGQTAAATYSGCNSYALSQRESFQIPSHRDQLPAYFMADDLWGVDAAAAVAEGSQVGTTDRASIDLHDRAAWIC